MSILLGSLADDIAAALDAADVPYDVTVTRTETTIPNPDEPWNTEQTPVDYPAQGWVDAYELGQIDNTTILATDTRIMVLQSSLAIEPTSSETITVSGVTYTIVSVQADPAGTLWEVQGRV